METPHKAHLIWVAALAALVADVFYAILGRFNVKLPTFGQTQ